MNKKLNDYFLPDLCNSRAIIISLAVSEALVLAVTLIEGSLLQFSWQRFSVVSFFVQWVCLLSVAVICPARRIFIYLPTWLASTTAVIIVVLVTALVSVIGDWLWPSKQQQKLDWWWVVNNCVISSVFATMAIRHFYVQSQRRLQQQAELHARLNALQANIRPHFLFNTLNTVASLIAVDPEQAENMLLDLAQLFRVVLKSEDSLIALNDEIALAQRYLGIEKIRLGERMQVYWHLPEPLPEIQVPQLLLQPLLENAIYHGIQPNIEPGTINISVRMEKQGCVIQVNNTLGPNSGHHGHQIGQVNTRARLEAMAPKSLFVIEKTAKFYQVTMVIPQQEESA